MTIRAVALIGLITSTLVPIGAAYAKQPDPAPPQGAWPCEKDPAPALQFSDYWPGAGKAAGRDWHSDPTVAALVSDIAPRSVSEETATARIKDFASHAANRDIAMTRVVAGLVETIDAERKTIVAGIRRFNVRQGQIARRIEEGYKTLDETAPAATDKAATDQRAALDEQMIWDTRIFEDRQRMLPVICKQPDLLEARLKSLADAARGAANETTRQP